MINVRKYTVSVFIFAPLFFASLFIKAQIHCADADFVPNTPDNIEFVFDSFKDYINGVTINGAVKLRIDVPDLLPSDGLCRWILYMEIDNKGGATPADEWETIGTYTATGDVPKIEVLDIRLSNICNTSRTGTVFVDFVNDGDIIDIIDNVGPIIPAGTCVVNVCGPGSYLTNYGEYNFTVDFMINLAPGSFQCKAGMYQLDVKFWLEEVP